MEGGMAEFFEILFIGLLAGFEIGVHYGIGSPPGYLSEAAQISLRQALVRRLRILAPSLFLPAFLLAVWITVQERQAPGELLRWVAVGMLLLWIGIRIVQTVPVNSATLGWNPEAPPAGWRSLVERTERFHVVAAWAVVVAFLCSLISA
jgi:hypothetical protein